MHGAGNWPGDGRPRLSHLLTRSRHSTFEHATTTLNNTEIGSQGGLSVAEAFFGLI